MTASYNNAPSGKRMTVAILTTFHAQRVCERGLFCERLMPVLVMLLMQHMQQQHQRIQRLGRQH
jgi:hypothetical protein